MYACAGHKIFHLVLEVPQICQCHSSLLGICLFITSYKIERIDMFVDTDTYLLSSIKWIMMHHFIKSFWEQKFQGSPARNSIVLVVCGKNWTSSRSSSVYVHYFTDHAKSKNRAVEIFFCVFWFLGKKQNDCSSWHLRKKMN